MSNQRMNTKSTLEEDTESQEQIHTQSVSTEETYRCALCEQEFMTDQLVTVSTTVSDDSLCSYCADSLFDEFEQQTNAGKQSHSVDDTGPQYRSSDTNLDSSTISENPNPTSIEKSDQSRRASAVSWTPPRVGTNGGVLGTILSIHSLSLSLLWAIHRTNVRLIERFFDEVDMQMITILWLTLSTALMMVATLT
jgi:hypothetical protein